MDGSGSSDLTDHVGWERRDLISNGSLDGVPFPVLYVHVGGRRRRWERIARRRVVRQDRHITEPDILFIY